MKTVALTGATGFIGRRLMSELPKRGYKVRALLRRPAPFALQCDSAVIGDLTRPQNDSFFGRRCRRALGGYRTRDVGHTQ
jgi:nucleoside-diphosphate-sugar epimerase